MSLQRRTKVRKLRFILAIAAINHTTNEMVTKQNRGLQSFIMSLKAVNNNNYYLFTSWYLLFKAYSHIPVSSDKLCKGHHPANVGGHHLATCTACIITPALRSHLGPECLGKPALQCVNYPLFTAEVMKISDQTVSAREVTEAIWAECQDVHGGWLCVFVLCIHTFSVTFCMQRFEQKHCSSKI